MALPWAYDEAKGLICLSSNSWKVIGRLRGIGICNYIELAGGMPREFAEMRIKGSTNRVEVMAGSGPMGQSCETAYAQLAVALLGVEPTRVDVIMRGRWRNGTSRQPEAVMANASVALTSLAVMSVQSRQAMTWRETSYSTVQRYNHPQPMTLR